jgi:hypothetical protein
MTGVHVLSEPSELGGLSTLRSRGRRRIRLSGRLAGHERSAEWERDLNRHYLACGCDAGARGTFIGLIGATLLAIDALMRGWLGWTGLVLLSLALIVAASGLGKLVGLLQANRRLKQLIHQIQQQVTHSR